MRIDSDIDALLKSLEDDSEAVEANAERLFRDMIEGVADEFIRDVSGRKADDTGLNVLSGRLQSSIESLVEHTPGVVTFAVFNRGADYWYYHEVGAGFNPKRLDWYEFWNTNAFADVEFAGERLLGMVA